MPPPATSPDDALWDGTPVGVRREKLPEVIPKEDRSDALGVESRARTEQIRGIRLLSVKSVFKPSSLSCPRLSALTLYQPRRNDHGRNALRGRLLVL